MSFWNDGRTRIPSQSAKVSAIVPWAAAAQVAAIVAYSIRNTLENATNISKKTRDAAEPGRARKLAMEVKMAAVVRRYLGREKAKFLAAHKAADDPATDDPLEADLYAVLVAALRDGLIIAAPQYVSFTTARGQTIAQAWAKARAHDLAKEIAGTTDDQIAAAVEKFASGEGMTMGEIAAQLFSDAVTQARAEMIATTEITRAYASANLEAAEQMAKDYPDAKIMKRWATNNDDIVCDDCGPLNQVKIPYDEEFADGVDAPPYHPRCRCWMLVAPEL